ncbi:hypothetical protein SUGI_0010570 [Cryptomeria japonica]|uniref:uncharacterized protein LOC131041870 n=1 Tax=Cryptomeria japonica TaxID=3369 RepID=UPI002408AE44|nr:uncharacterized protein LOC131041870 [Cryptomeria japonica]GLJ05079.1 hypothetical protein SUGI_0010570 [Cryptomeria japonica]
MANWLWSCAYPSKTANLIRFNGGLERIKIKMGMKVAELMLDNPNHFVCNLGSLQAGHRILALSAEEEIERGNTYVLLPMQKLRCVLSEADMGRIQQLKNKSNAISSSHSKIVPLSQDDFVAEKSSLPKLVANEEEIEKMKMRIDRQRCWKPSLHTIEETRSLKFTENAPKRPILTYRLR